MSERAFIKLSKGDKKKKTEEIICADVSLMKVV